MKAIRVLILFSLILILSSCSLFQSAYDVASEHVEVTWKKDKDKEQIVVDSIVIKFNPVYWREPVIWEDDSTMINEEVDRKQDGYQIWILETNTVRYNEIKKLDTVIYIYRNKK
jgi:hypothetical protein